MFDPATIRTAMGPPQKTGSHSVVTIPQNKPRSQTPGRQGRSSALGSASRPKSPGRNTGSRSRDIVQEVYDRMGVSFVRGQSVFELDDSKNNISINPGTNSVTKSPSRGRSNVRYMYNATTQETVESDARSTRSGASVGKTASRWSSSRSVSTNFQSSNRPVVAYPTPTTNEEYREDGSFPRASRTTNKQLPSYLVDTRDDGIVNHEINPNGAVNNEGDAETRDVERDGRTSPLSIKSRITAFSVNANGKPLSSPKKPFGTSPVSQKIYNLNKNNGIIKKPKASGDGLHHHSTTPSNRSAKSGVANSFLAAINNKQTTTTPLVDVSTTREIPVERPSDLSTKSIPAEILPNSPRGGCEDHSIAASSVSGEDFATSTTIHKREVTAYEKSRSKHTTTSHLTSAMVDQMIEEKLRAKFAGLEGSLLDKLDQLEKSTSIRLQQMEKELGTLKSEVGTMSKMEKDDGKQPEEGSTSQSGREDATPATTPTSMPTTASTTTQPSPNGSFYYRSFRL